MDTSVYKQKLEEEKKLLETELQDIGKFDKNTGDWQATPEAQTAPEADESDMADRSEDFEERSGTLDALESRLKDINTALDKISNGVYGLCEVSNEPIEEDRLSANPAARTCKSHMDKVL